MSSTPVPIPASNPLWKDILGAVLIASAVNAAIVLFGPKSATPDPGILPGWLVGLIWVVLFGLMGAAYGHLRRSPFRKTQAQASVVVLLLSCAAYPFYTGLLTDRRTGLAGNVVTIVLSMAVMLLCLRASRVAALLILPTFLWVILATVLMLKGLV